MIFWFSTRILMSMKNCQSSTKLLFSSKPCKDYRRKESKTWNLHLLSKDRALTRHCWICLLEKKVMGSVIKSTHMIVYTMLLDVPLPITKPRLQFQTLVADLLEQIPDVVLHEASCISEVNIFLSFMQQGKLTRALLALFTLVLKQWSCSKARIRVAQEIYRKLGSGPFS